MTKPQLKVYTNRRRTELPRELEREGALLAQLASLTRPDAYDTTYLTHGIHPYPAKYIPQLPNLIIREHTNERHTVLDPFCGSGTSLLEAAVLGRRSYGVDLNRVATLVSQAKTTPLELHELEQAEQFIERVRAMRTNRLVPKPAGAYELNLDHWFQPNVISELCALREEIERVQSGSLRGFLACIYSSIIVAVSNQESETRYAAIDKDIPDGDVFRRFSAKLSRELPRIRELSALGNVQRNVPQVFNSDVRQMSALGIAENSIDLVVTSPPYPNSFDYYLYHKWRMYWLGADYKEVMQGEIGSRREHSSLKQPMANYIAKMRDALIPVSRVLKPSKLAYFFVGDAVIGGCFFDISQVFREVIAGTDLRMVADTNYSLESVTRSFREKTSENCHGGRRSLRKLQHVLVFEKYNRARVSLAPDRTQATPKATTRTIDLTTDSVSDGDVVSLSSDDGQRHIHGLGRYPSKFIPEIPRWAIDAYSKPGDLVLDPFSGSGTTAVEALMAGRNALGSDISPYSRLLTEAKTSLLNGVRLRELADTFVEEVKSGFRTSKQTAERFELDDFWFPPGYLDQLASATQFIRHKIPEPYQSFFLAVVSTVIRACSYQDEGQIKVKRDPKKVVNGTPSPASLLLEAIRKSVARKQEFLSLVPAGVKCSAHTASADSLLSSALVQPASVDLVVTSPPYINAMNYPMTHRYENIVSGLLKATDKTSHERLYFGSERVYASEYSTLQLFPLVFERAAELNNNLEHIFAGEPKRSFITYRFFSLMHAAFRDLVTALKPGGTFVLVVGRNTIKGIPVDTFGLLTSMLESLGMKRELCFEYEIIKNAFKLTRHSTADIIKTDGVAVLRKASK